MKIQVTACDIDQSVPAKEYTIEVADGRRVAADLCEAHAEPIEALMRQLEAIGGTVNGGAKAEVTIKSPAVDRPPRPRKEPTKRPDPAPRRRPKVTTLEEIEAAKRA
ncbi:hypothetical protein ACFYWP_01790 [Actinacidiphila glaucinigra]|uniref:hypothetical protein n=1 Tax=Actinacidiphila glaucinigra TaxID=235986 RepID=UPI0036C1F50F